MNNSQIAQYVAKHMNKQKNLIITAGAGLGLDSGFLDYSGEGKFFKIFPQFKKFQSEGFETFADFGTLDFLKKYPKNAWYLHLHLTKHFNSTPPHAGFKIMNELATKHFNNNYYVYTSNVDGHFQRSSFDEDKVVECHGTINYTQCNSCQDITWLDPKIYNMNMIDETGEIDNLPYCKHCKGLLRQNIDFFEDNEFIFTREEKKYNNFRKFIDINDNFLILEFGCGLFVPDLRILDEEILKTKNASLVRINPRNSGLDSGNNNVKIISKNSNEEHLKDVDGNTFISVEMGSKSFLELLKTYI